MTQRKFKLTEETIPQVQQGQLSFQVGFERDKGDGTRTMIHYSHCPVITIREGDVVATTNDWAAQMIEAMVIPNRVKRPGVPDVADGTKMFLEVDVATTHQHDLDQTFSAYKA